MNDKVLIAQDINLLRQHSSGYVLKDVSIELEQGDFHILLGPNGAGKSTLLKILTAEIQPSKGQISMQGKSLNKFSLNQLAQQRSVLPQLKSVMFPMTVYEVCALGRTPYMGSRLSHQDKTAIEKALQQLELDDFVNKDYSMLSGGEQQRVQIARVLCQQTPLLFLDEPLSALDIHYQFKVLDLLHELSQQGRTILCVMHDINLSLRYANQLTFLKQGEVVFQGDPKTIHSVEIFEKVYDIKAHLFEDDSSPQIKVLGPTQVS